MFKPYFAFIGTRYSFAKRTDHFISFISYSTVFGLALGVTVLITVLSVMNGFGKEIRKKMLSVAPHITIRSVTGKIHNWQPLIAELEQKNYVTSASPFVENLGIVVKEGTVKGVQLKGINSTKIAGIGRITDHIIAGHLDLTPGKYQVAVGIKLAAALRLSIGDTITMIMPEADVSPLGVQPRIKRLTVTAIYETDSTLDSAHVLLNITDANKLFRMREKAINAIYLRVYDELVAPTLAKNLNQELTSPLYAYSWREEFSSLFRALQMEKTVMACILVLIISVAAFNLVSSLVMVVSDKRRDIAVLRTMGANKAEIVGLFMTQGVVIGLLGTVLGLIGGLLLASNISSIVASIERGLEIKLISSDVHFISYLPSDIQAQDVVAVCSFALLISFVATIYPASKAAKINAAEALKSE